jgi:hypothetical protein
MSTEHEKFETWAVVELFGHQIIAGLVTEQQIGGQGFVRVDVPSVDVLEVGGTIAATDAFTKFYGAGAIYAMSPCSEDVVLDHVRQARPKPIHLYLPELRAIPARSDDFDGDVF